MDKNPIDALIQEAVNHIVPVEPDIILAGVRKGMKKGILKNRLHRLGRVMTSGLAAGMMVFVCVLLAMNAGLFERSTALLQSPKDADSPPPVAADAEPEPTLTAVPLYETAYINPEALNNPRNFGLRLTVTETVISDDGHDIEIFFTAETLNGHRFSSDYITMNGWDWLEHPAPMRKLEVQFQMGEYMTDFDAVEKLSALQDEVWHLTARHTFPEALKPGAGFTLCIRNSAPISYYFQVLPENTLAGLVADAAIAIAVPPPQPPDRDGDIDWRNEFIGPWIEKEILIPHQLDWPLSGIMPPSASYISSVGIINERLHVQVYTFQPDENLFLIGPGGETIPAVRVNGERGRSFTEIDGHYEGRIPWYTPDAERPFFELGEMRYIEYAYDADINRLDEYRLLMKGWRIYFGETQQPSFHFDITATNPAAE